MALGQGRARHQPHLTCIYLDDTVVHGLLNHIPHLGYGSCRAMLTDHATDECTVGPAYGTPPFSKLLLPLANLTLSSTQTYSTAGGAEDQEEGDESKGKCATDDQTDTIHGRTREAR